MHLLNKLGRVTLTHTGDPHLPRLLLPPEGPIKRRGRKLFQRLKRGARTWSKKSCSCRRTTRRLFQLTEKSPGDSDVFGLSSQSRCG